MLELYQKMYTTLFNSIDNVMEYITREMMIPETYDWNHTREILLKLQAAHQKTEDMYVNFED